MAIKKRTQTFTSDTAKTLGLGAVFGKVLRVDVLSSADTSVAVAVVDGDGVTVATFASADYTTRARRYVGPVETAVYDTAGDPSADTEGTTVGVVAHGPLTITPTGLGSGTLTVDVYVEV